MSSDVTLGRYRHFKGGEYEVAFVAQDVETEEPLVVHLALHSRREHRVWSLADCIAHVSRDAHPGPRFVRIEPVGGRP